MDTRISPAYIGQGTAALKPAKQQVRNLQYSLQETGLHTFSLFEDAGNKEI